MTKRSSWCTFTILLLAICGQIAVADIETALLSYDVETPRLLVYNVRRLSLQHGTGRSDVRPVQDETFQLAVRCLGNGQIRAEMSSYTDRERETVVDGTMCCSIRCVVGRHGKISQVEDAEYDLGEAELDGERADLVRYLLRSYVVFALNEVLIHLPEQERGSGHSWLDSGRSWPFDVAKDVDVVFPVLTLEGLPSDENNSLGEIHGTVLEYGPSKKLPGLCGFKEVTTGQYVYDAKLKIIREAVTVSEQELNDPGREEEVRTRYGVVKREIRLAGPPVPLDGGPAIHEPTERIPLGDADIFVNDKPVGERPSGDGEMPVGDVPMEDKPVGQE